MRRRINVDLKNNVTFTRVALRQCLVTAFALLNICASSIAFAFMPDKAAEVIWDHYGVAHIYAADDVAGFKAFGWSQMEAHADLILDLYAHARGRAAEYWGEAGFVEDVIVHQIRLPEQAEHWLARLTPEQRSRIEAFVSGMNAYAKAHPEKISARSRAVLPVRPTDPLAHLQRIVQEEFIASDFFWRLAANSPFGSNVLVIAPARSADGHAMLVINPHLEWSGIETWFESQLNIPSQTIYGVSLVGSPFISIGFSEYGGWSHTVNEYRGLAVYRLSPVDGGYLLDGKAMPFEITNNLIKVKASDGRVIDRRVTFERSVHGPVFRRADGVYAISLAADEPVGMLQQYWDMAAARNVTEFEAAQRHQQMAFFNTAYASRAGDIYYDYGGVVPTRKTGDFPLWSGVVPGDRSEFLLGPPLSYEQMPHFSNPPGGFIANSNEPPWNNTVPPVLKPANYPAYVARPPSEGFSSLFRSQGAINQILEKSTITYDELVAMKQSTRLGMADRTLPDLFAAAVSSSDPLVKEAVAVLTRWDRRTDADSHGALLFMAWAERLLGSRDHAAIRAAFAVDYDPDRPFTTPSGLANPDHAVNLLEEAAKETLLKWGSLDAPYGQEYRLRMAGRDLPASGGPGGLGAYKNAHAGSEPAAADGTRTIVGGDSFAAVVSFGPHVRAVAILPYGNSSQSDSSFLGDQLELFSEGRLRPVRFYRGDVEADVQVRETVK